MKKIYFLIFLVSATVSAQLEWRALTVVPEVPGEWSRFDDVFFLDENLGWAANGSFAGVYKTTDGGATWTEQLSEVGLGDNYYFRNIQFLNPEIGFLGTLNGAFFKTIDGGANWETVVLPSNPAAICGLDCVGASTIYGCGSYFSDAGYIIKSTDSGSTWEYIDMGAYATALVEVLFVDENLGYASGSDETGGVVLKTTDGGTTWIKLYSTNIPGEYVWKLQILQSDSNVIFGSVESISPMNGKLIRSLDNGISWTSKEVPDTDIQAVGFLTETHGWMGGHNSGFLETFDAGDTWIDTGLGSNLNRIFIMSNELAYCSGSTIYKFSELPLSTTAFTEKARVPLKAIVNPNPVKDKLNLTVEFSANDHLKIELYDSTGHRIKLLLRDNIAGASKKSYNFDFPYSSGVYILNLHSDTGRQSIKIVK